MLQGGHALSAQTPLDSSETMLPAIVIRSFRPDRSGLSSWTADSTTRTLVQTAADQLRWSNAVQLRSNGPGLLSTASMRGAGPARTPVFWSGLNLQSPMNGVYDLSLMPVWPGDRLEVWYGGQSASLSNGAMAGSVQIIPDTGNIRPGVHGQAGMSLGSFSLRAAQLGLDSRFKGFQQRLRTSWTSAENDFSFRNTSLIGAPVQHQQNNRMERLDLQHFSGWNTRRWGHLETAVWYQKAHREIPPAMTEAPVESWQRDEALRATATWQSDPKLAYQWKQQIAWLDETIVFARLADRDTSRSKTLLWRAEYTRPFATQWIWRTGLQAQYLRAVADGYSDTARWQDQRRLSAMSALEKNSDRWKWTLVARQEWAQDQGAPFTWSVAGVYRLLGNLNLRTQAARTFTLPTFNDRFWQGLGNPDLEPEHGHNINVHLDWELDKEGWICHFETGLFHLLMDNWILWQPGPDGLFRPGNLRQVWSRGAETEFSLLYSQGQWRFRSKIRYQFAQTTNTKVYGGVNSVLHKQLPYTPLHTASADMTVEFRGLQARYVHQWTGTRFVTSDHSQSLPAFHTATLLLSCKTGRRGYCSFQLDNCWNTAYQMVAFRPMPGRNWNLGYLLHF